jgi:hypothetical protein
MSENFDDPGILPDEAVPHADRRRRRRPAPYLLWGIVVGILLGLVFVLALTQTDRGRARILAFTLDTLGGRFTGVLTIDRIDGNLITGAKLHNLQLRDHDGVHLAIIDSAYIRYRVPTLVGGDLVITRLEAYSADINLFLMPGDTIWNYQRILTDPDPDPDARAGATLVERLLLRDARVTIRSPWEPDPTYSAAAQERETQRVLDDPRWIVEAVPGGFLRTMRIDLAHADVSELLISPDERGGIYLDLDDASGDIRMWDDPPLVVRSARASLHLREGIVNYRAPEIVLPNSRGESVGRIDLRGDRPLYDVVILSPRFALADLRFLYPWLPEDPAEGVGSARLWLEDIPEGLGVVARDLRLTMPGTEVSGRFGIIANESLRFVDVDLTADPLQVDDVERLFPVDLTVEGLVIGGAVIRGES